MSKSIKIMSVLAVALVVAGCHKKNQEEEIVYIDPTPVAPEPVFDGKYK